MDDVVTNRIESTLSFTLKQNKKMTQTYKLQDGKEEGKQVVKKVFERNPVYFKFNVLLKKYHNTNKADLTARRGESEGTV